MAIGVFAEEAFFRGRIGISYPIFITVFYSMFFWRFRKIPFSHQRLGSLLLFCISLLALGYFLYDNMVFYTLNIVGLPILVIFHLVLVTSPKNLVWSRPVFLYIIIVRLIESIKYNFQWLLSGREFVKNGIDEKKYNIWKKVFIGIGLSIPLLFIVLNLLVSADKQFERIIGRLPELFNIFDSENLFRIIICIFYTLVFFGLLQVLQKKKLQITESPHGNSPVNLDSIIAMTVLVLVNAVYLWFVAVLFRYFFGGSLEGSFTYAEYARRGFFELLTVTIINLTLTVVVLSCVKQTLGTGKFMKSLLSILVLSSGVILSSAFLRMLMYEEAYGFTFTRVLVHSFMIFLFIIFLYTLVRIWMVNLSLFHFYFISALVYYTSINIINMDDIVVKENLQRYEEIDKIDVNYLSSLSETGTQALIDLYKKNPEWHGLRDLLKEKQAFYKNEKRNWQSYNLTREKSYQELMKLKF
nr:DUF4173 domain-containing protein [Neobacillus terrae]